MTRHRGGTCPHGVGGRGVAQPIERLLQWTGRSLQAAVAARVLLTPNSARQYPAAAARPSRAAARQVPHGRPTGRGQDQEHGIALAVAKDLEPNPAQQAMRQRDGHAWPASSMATPGSSPVGRCRRHTAVDGDGKADQVQHDPTAVGPRRAVFPRPWRRAIRNAAPGEMQNVRFNGIVPPYHNAHRRLPAHRRYRPLARFYFARYTERDGAIRHSRLWRAIPAQRPMCKLAFPQLYA
jgi:hypothetical protein